MIAPPILETDGITFSYKGRRVFEGLSLTIHSGEILGIVGPNGAGKSTLLKILGGLLRPQAGEVRCLGKPIAHMRRHELARLIAYVPQEYSLELPFRVSEVVLMGRYPHSSSTWLEGRGDLEAARVAMEKTDVWSLRDRRFDELSGGERRRVVLAQAFCQETPIILLDEPASSLDAGHELALERALKNERLHRNVTTIIVTHDLAAAARLCDRLICLDSGRVVGDGRPLEVASSEALAHAFGVRFHVGQLEDGPSFIIPLEIVEPWRAYE